MDNDRNDKKISMIINSVTVLIMIIIILVALYIYRENIYDLFNKKDSDGDPSENFSDFSVLSLTDDPTSRESAEDSEFTEETSDEIKTETETETEDETETEIEVAGTTQSDLLKYMFENAIEIPGTPNKIEPPPDGRSEEIQYGAVPLSDTIPEPYEYFKNSLFLGDSVTSGFDLFKARIKFNGETVLEYVNVVAVSKYGVYYAIQPLSDSSTHPRMNGEQTLPEDIIAQKDVKNIFICLGLNDLTFAKVSNYVKYYSKLIDNIKSKNPDKNIAIMSVTPLVSGQQSNALNNEVIIEANNALLEFAKENNIYFIDYAAAIRDSKNCLPKDLSSDGYCHLTVPAYDMLVEYLLYHPIK